MRFKYIITKKLYSKISKEFKRESLINDLEKIVKSDSELPKTTCIYKIMYRTEHNNWPGAPRTYWFVENREDVRLFVLRDIIMHKDEPNSWNTKNDKKAKYFISEHSFDDEERAEIECEFEKLLNPQEEKKSHNSVALSQSEEAFLSNIANEINPELLKETIYETKEWINKIRKSGFTDYANVALKISDYIIENLSSEEGWHKTEVKNIEIILYHFHKEDSVWILVDLIDKESEESNTNYQKGKPPVDFYRGYPYSFLLDPDNWREMELEEKSNMALSEKQIKILKSDFQYPIFLTGRAGSGKSTLLQYLFAEIIIKYIKASKSFDGNIYEPVYLSYSQNLVEDALKLCKILFEKNDAYQKSLRESNIEYKKDIQDKIGSMFWVFKDLIKDDIKKNQPGICEKKFPDGKKYISFPQFNAKWNLRYGKVKEASKKYGPSISWYVIRTYIKGWDVNGYLSPDDYQNIGEKNKDKSISYETYKEIYEKVWMSWYKDLKNEGFWDDQDLVRYCLNNNCVNERFSAVFCDESQDFTRIELEFILKSSSFTYRKINNLSDINHMPFVFAGDESQTLNPTGFSWDLLRGFFTKKLCEYIGIDEKVNDVIIPDTIELSENFRSTQQIVKLSNRIQLMKSVMFGLKNLEPQKPYFSQEGNDIYCLLPSDASSFEELKKKKVTLIIPAEDGESIQDFISNSSLKDKIHFDEDGTPDITILNPIQAKGLEYPNVAIFGFNKNYNNSSANDIIQEKYQISNAYVAVTRAQSNLYIIDNFNLNSFWSFAFNYDDPKLDMHNLSLEEGMLENLSTSQKPKWSKEDLGWIVYEDDINISDENLEYLRSDKHKDDLEKRAEERNDSKLMRQAARKHKMDGNYMGAARCLAKAYAIDEEYLNAAHEFEKANMYKEAVDCYWIELSEKKDQNIISHIASLKDYVHNLKLNLCTKCKDSTVRDLNIAIKDSLDYITNNEEEQSNNIAWQIVLNQILKNAKIKSLTDKKLLEQAYDKSKSLTDYNIILDNNAFAELAYKAESYNLAVAIWEEQDNLNRPANYYYAKLKIVKYPESLEYYEGTKDNIWQSLLLEDFNKHRKIELDDKHKELVSSAILSVSKNKKDYEAFLPFMLKNANYNESNVILSKAKTIEANINYTLIRGLIETRFTNLSEWTKSEDIFIDTEANTLQNAIHEIKLMREDGFKDKIKQDLEPLKGGQKRIVFNRKYGKYSRTSASKLLFTEFGKVMESTGFFLNAIVFYEWAQENTDDQEIKLLMKKRWIACKERQADNDDSSDYWQDAQKERDLYNIHEDLPIVPILSEDDWEKMFQHYMVISSEVRKRRPRISEDDSITEGIDIPVIEKPQGIPEKTDGQKDSVPVKKLSNKKYEFSHKNYSIVYFPSKGDIVLKNNDEEFSVRIKNGKFPSEADFYLKEGRLYQTENDVMTPFVIEEDSNFVTLKIYDGNEFTGLLISAELNK